MFSPISFIYEGTVSVSGRSVPRQTVIQFDAASNAARGLEITAGDEAVQAMVAKTVEEEREGTSLMLFCMGRIGLRHGQHVSLCLFEPRYRLMVRTALSSRRQFGIVDGSTSHTAQLPVCPEH